MELTNEQWGIDFPKNPYKGQIFYYPDTEDIFEYVISHDQPQWMLITRVDFSKPY